VGRQGRHHLVATGSCRGPRPSAPSAKERTSICFSPRTLLLVAALFILVDAVEGPGPSIWLRTWLARSAPASGRHLLGELRNARAQYRGVPEVRIGIWCPGRAPNAACVHGLYSNFAGSLAADVRVYEPSVALWSDGADKRRFVRLPPWQRVDTADMAQWVFPVGTQIRKEFSIGGRRAETRYLQKRPDGKWFRTTYAWSPD
jgi:hypothetical protein